MFFTFIASIFGNEVAPVFEFGNIAIFVYNEFDEVIWISQTTLIKKDEVLFEIYAKELKVSREKLIRALVLSNLLTTHIKTGIGRLSAFCGAVAAGCAAGAAIAYLHDGDLEMVSHTLVNSLAIVSGIICDGAKASCAAKIASSVDAGILGFNLYKQGNQFYAGDGIVSKGVENTIRNVGIVASQGMVETDKEIIELMFKS